MPIEPNPDYDLFRLSEEHEALREAVRGLAEDRIAPRAAEIDETGEIPEGCLRVARAGRIPRHPHPRGVWRRGWRPAGIGDRRRGGREGVRLQLADPAVNKLGTTPLLVGGDEQIKQRYLPEVASGEAMFSYALSEREAGSDAAAMKTRAVRDGDSWVLNGQKSWITNAGISKYYTVMASTAPDAGRQGNLCVRGPRRRRRVLARHTQSANWASTAPRPGRSSSRTCESRPTA